MAARKKASPAKFIKLQEAKIQLERFGKGKPLLLLQGEETYEAGSPIVTELAKKYEIIMPWAPGYGRSTLPDSDQLSIASPSLDPQTPGAASPITGVVKLQF